MKFCSLGPARKPVLEVHKRVHFWLFDLGIGLYTQECFCKFHPHFSCLHWKDWTRLQVHRQALPRTICHKRGCNLSSLCSSNQVICVAFVKLSYLVAFTNYLMPNFRTNLLCLSILCFKNYQERCLHLYKNSNKNLIAEMRIVTKLQAQSNLEYRNVY